MLRFFRRLLGILVAVAALTGCSTLSSAQPTAGAGRVVVYSGRSENLVAPVFAQFTQATGIQVEVRYGSTAELAATLLEEGQNSPADVFYAQDPGGLGAVSAAGLLAPLPADLLAQVEPRFRAEDGTWVGISGRARVIVYHSGRLGPDDLPQDVRGFTEPRWRGKIGWAPTNASFQAMVTAMRQMWGEEETRAWLLGMQANQPVVFEGNAPIVAAVGHGEIEVGLVNHYYLYRFLREEGETFPARNHFMNNGGPDSLILVSGIGRLAGGKNPENALKLIQFLLSPVAQQYFASQTYEYPVVAGVNPERGLPPLESLTAAAIRPEQLADLQGTLNLLHETGILP
ncbi:MAG: iron ABC transporter substrate-binding protein [Thermanaerothrix sp.]|nr:iron ABC transporter substrate-binding protein [Thermanaerothrix sp.]